MRKVSIVLAASILVGGCSSGGPLDLSSAPGGSSDPPPVRPDASLSEPTDASLPPSPSGAPADAGTAGDPADSGPLDGARPDARQLPEDAAVSPADGGAEGGAARATDAGSTPKADGGHTPPPVSADAASPAVDSGAPPPTGPIGPNGGTVSRLYFAVIGDTRPPTIDDIAAYPTEIITRIYADIASLSPEPLFAVGTGDYVYATPHKSGAAAQLDLYLRARSQYSGLFFPALGNHDCANAVPSNCGPGNADGVPPTYATYMDKLLTPIGKSLPYYSFDVNAKDGSWTAKLVFVAANAWDSVQATWLEATLQKPTTYTFIMRHEPKVPAGTPANDIAVGGPPSDAIIEQHPYTMKITGHVHLHAKSSAKEIIIGNGGAPLNGGDYGFGLVEQLPDGNIQFDELNYLTLAPDLGFRFYVRPDGTEVKTP